jgi:hypothetical protein
MSQRRSLGSADPLPGPSKRRRAATVSHDEDEEVEEKVVPHHHLGNHRAAAVAAEEEGGNKGEGAGKGGSHDGSVEEVDVVLGNFSEIEVETFQVNYEMKIRNFVQAVNEGVRTKTAAVAAADRKLVVT